MRKASTPTAHRLHDRMAQHLLNAASAHTPEAALIAAVIAKAMVDLTWRRSRRPKPTDKVDAEAKADALAWMGGADFRRYCAMIGLNPQWVGDLTFKLCRALNLRAEVEQMGREFKSGIKMKLAA